MNRKYIGILYLALIGAVVATLCDNVHSFTGALIYPKPDFFGQPWWISIAFLFAFLLMGIGYLLFDKFLPSKINRSYSTSPGNFIDFTESLMLFAFIYLLSGFGHEYPFVLTGIFYSTYLLRMATSHDKAFILIVSLTVALMGSIVENSHLGENPGSYSHTDFLNLPFWLPALYLHGAFALREGMRYFVYRTNDE